MRRAAKTDKNQTQVVSALRRSGFSVVSLAAIGKGVPDLLIAKAGITTLIEVKNGNKPPSQRRLTPDQVEFHRTWKGLIITINSVDELITWLATAEIASRLNQHTHD